MAISKSVFTWASLIVLSSTALAELPYQLRNGQPASASEVMSNFEHLEQLVGESITVAADCSNDNQALRNAYFALPVSGFATIEVSGRCEAAIGIERSDLMIAPADGKTATLYTDDSSRFANPGWGDFENPNLFYVHANNVHFENLNFDFEGTGIGPGALIFIGRNADVRMTGNTVNAQGARYSAIGIHQTSTLRLFEDNKLYTDASNVIELANSSALLIRGDNLLQGSGQDTVGIQVGASGSVRTYNSDGTLTIRHTGHPEIESWNAALQVRASGAVRLTNHGVLIEGYPLSVDARGGSSVQFNNWDQIANLMTIKSRMQVQTGAEIHAVGTMIDTGDDRLEVERNGSMIIRDGSTLISPDVRIDNNAYFLIEQNSTLEAGQFVLADGAQFEMRHATLKVSEQIYVTRNSGFDCYDGAINMINGLSEGGINDGSIVEIRNCPLTADPDVRPEAWVSRGSSLVIEDTDDETWYTDNLPAGNSFPLNVSLDASRLQLRNTDITFARLQADNGSQLEVRGGSIRHADSSQCGAIDDGCGEIRIDTGSTLTLQEGSGGISPVLRSNIQLWGLATLLDYRDRNSDGTDFATTPNPDFTVYCNTRGTQIDAVSAEKNVYICGYE
ncbi:MAG: hypothetical protein HWE20_17225 [Gammaproteobacteria bacterium]|nr:hypothetical protein [Gammaproteobacteria bacterium]